MKRNRDPLPLTPHWHVDCRIESELPDESVVGTRFLVNVLFSATALGMILFTGWVAYLCLNVRHQTRDWEQRINDNRAEVRDIQRMQREYAAETIKIDQAFALIRPQLFVSGFIANVGRTKPDPMTIDIIEWNDSGVVIRGNLRESSERGMRLLGGYVEQLRKNDKIAPLFRDINLTDLERGATGDSLRFEIHFRLKAKT
jgi:hypothetical protein